MSDKNDDGKQKTKEEQSELSRHSEKPAKKQRGRPKLIIKTDIKIIKGPITVAFD
jgi:hypothetical protein